MTWKRWPGYPRPAPIFYRLYYDSNTGRPLFYSMEDLPGTYIDIDQATYTRNSMRLRVVNGQIQEQQWRVLEKLVPSEQGTACDPWSVAVVVESDRPNQRWSKRTYETR